jgi:tetratricopeptide (TPR) repeat protein
MPNEPNELEFPYDFFVSRRGIAADAAIEVADVLESAGHKVLVQDFDIPFSANFVAAMHEAVKSARHFVGLLTEDYDVSPFTREEWTAFFAVSRPTGGKRRLVILRVQDVAPPGLLASIVYGDLVNVTDREKRREIILTTAEGRSIGKRRGNQIFHGVPPRNPDFTGRADLLASLHQMLNLAGKPAAITQAAIYGLGGVGKTSLAAEYAHLHVDNYAGIWWVAAENRTILITSLAELAGVLDSRFANESNTEKAARAALATLAQHERPWLLVYDNVSDPDEIRDFRPSKGAPLLITTRHPDWGGQANELEIDVLERGEAIDFLLKRTDRSDDGGAALLAEALGYLPLALDHAGAYVTSAAISLSEYARRYQDLIARAPKGSLSTAATFDLAIEKAKEDCEDAEKMLGFFSVMAPERIPLDFVDNSIISERQRDEAMIALSSVSLIKRDNIPNGEIAVSIHRLVRAAMRARLVSTKRLAQTLTSATARLVAMFPKNLEDPKSFPRCERLLPHALALGRDPENRSKFTVILLHAAGTSLGERGAYTQSESICREAMVIAEKIFGRNHPGCVPVMQSTANTLTRLGKLSEAENLCRSAIQIYTRKRSGDDETLAVLLGTLGGILSSANRQSEAISYHLRAISILRKKFGVKNRKLMGALSNAGIALQGSERPSEAEDFFREAISLSEKSFGSETREIVNAQSNLAELLREMGRHGEAEEIAIKALQGNERLFGRKHPGVAASMANFALILRDTGRIAAAETLFREAIEILIESIGHEHTDLGFVHAALSRLLVTNGRQADATDHASQALAIHTKNLDTGLLWSKRCATELWLALDGTGHVSDAADVRTRYQLDQ